MAKKKKPRQFPFPKLIKKSSLSGLILFFLWSIFQLYENVQIPQPTKLPSVNAPVELYSNQTQDNLTTLYEQAISQAKESITLVIYELRDLNIVQALKKKSEEGIPVHIVCDAKGSPGLKRQIPQANIVRRISKGIMHQKILIVDNKRLWLGSANLTSSSLNVHGNLVIGINHPILANMMTERAKSMDEDGSVTPLAHCKTVTGPQTLEQWILPDDQLDANKRIIDLMRGAKKCIKVAMFTWTRMDFAQEMIDAAKRGIHVEAVIDRNCGNGSGVKIVQTLAKAGIPIRLHAGQGLLHHKFAWIDDTTLINGSANWTDRAFKSNDDYFIIVYPLTDEQQKKMEKLWSVIQKQSKQPEKKTNKKAA